MTISTPKKEKMAAKGEEPPEKEKGSTPDKEKNQEVEITPEKAPLQQEQEEEEKEQEKAASGGCQSSDYSPQKQTLVVD